MSKVVQTSLSVCYSSGGICTLKSSAAGAYFRNNNSSKGGALYIYVPKDFKASSAEFINNSADAIGGGIFLRTEGEKETLLGSSSYYGLEKCFFVGNSAGDGGGLYQDSEIYGFSIKSSVFKENYAGERWDSREHGPICWPYIIYHE